MRLSSCSVLSVALVLAAGGSARAQSGYAQLDRDVRVSVRTDVLSFDVVASSQSDLFVSSDGRFFPSGGTAGATYVTVDGARVSNESAIDWAGSTDPQQHSFDAVGATRVEPGTHRVALVADPTAGPFSLGSASNLAAMMRPSGTVKQVTLPADSGPFDFQTAGLQAGTPAPTRPLLATDVGPGDAVVVGSGDAYRTAHAGDAMLGLSLDGRSLGNASALWSVQDLCECAELRGPLFTHAFLAGLSGPHRISLDASEFPWMSGEDPADYTVASGTTMLTLQGPMQVRGSAPTSHAADDWWDYVGVGTAEGWPGVPPVGTDVPLASAAFDVPASHDGVVMFLAKTRVQGDPADPGGTVTLHLALDGRPVGSVGVQQLAAPDGASQRTVAASYLASGDGALPPGRHTVVVYGRADGTFKHLAMVKDLNLIWFDDAASVQPAPAAPSTCDPTAPIRRAHDRWARYALVLRRRCAPSSGLTAKLTWRHRRGRVARRLEVRRVALTVGRARARVDRHAPFRWVLPAGPRRCTVRVTIHRRLGRARIRPISIRARVPACG